VSPDCSDALSTCRPATTRSGAEATVSFARLFVSASPVGFSSNNVSPLSTFTENSKVPSAAWPVGQVNDTERKAPVPGAIAPSPVAERLNV